MPKRMHDTDIWEEDWFIDMPESYQILWLYLKDQCDHAGLWRPNLRQYERNMRTQINVQDFLKHVNNGKERVVVLRNQRWYLTGYMAFHYGTVLNPRNPAVKGAIKLILDNGVPLKHIHKITNIDVIDYKYVDKQKGEFYSTSNIEENNQMTDYQYQKEEAPSEGLSRGYEAPHIKEKEKNTNTSINTLHSDLNKKGQEIFEITEMTVELPFSTPNFKMPKIIFNYDCSPLAEEVKKFLTQSNFHHFAMANSIRDPDDFRVILTEFVKHVLSKQEYQTANKLLGWLGSWYNKKQIYKQQASNSTTPPEILNNKKRDYSQINGWRGHQKK